MSVDWGAAWSRIAGLIAEAEAKKGASNMSTYHVRDWIEIRREYLRQLAELEGRLAASATTTTREHEMSENREHDIQVAQAEGNQAGGNAGSWVFDGNSSTEYAQRVLQGYEEGDPEVMDLEPSPLSGEWAGESIKELSAQFGIDLEDDEIATAFEQAFSDGFWDAVQESAAYIVKGQQ